MTSGVPSAALPAHEEAAAEAFRKAYADDWKSKLRYKKDSGAIEPGFHTYCMILENDPNLKGRIAFNEFASQIEKRELMPWGTPAGPLVDDDVVGFMFYLTDQFRIEPKRQTVIDAFARVASQAQFHPVREYLARLKWDGRPRIDGWLQYYLGAKIPSEQLALPVAQRGGLRYLELVAAKVLIAAVMRVMDPGSKFDSMLVLESGQGLGKSTAIKILGEPWVQDTPIRPGDKDSYLVTRGRWIVEWAELDALSRAETSAVKAYLSSAVDVYRAPYARFISSVPRQFIVIGTVNHGGYLKDDTGGRRFWPVECTDVALDELRNDRDQLWAEGYARYRAGELPYIAADDWPLFNEEQARRYVADPWETTIREWLEVREQNADELDKDGGQLLPLTTDLVLRRALKLDTTHRSPQNAARVGKILQRLGCTRQRNGKPDEMTGIRGWHYVPARPSTIF